MRTMILAAAVTAALAPSPLFSQTLSQDSAFPAARLAFFNVQRVVAESAIGDAALAKLEAFRSKMASQIDQRNRALQVERQKLEQAAAGLSPTARVEMEGGIRKFELDVQRLLEDAQAEFLGMQRDIESDLHLKIVPVVEAVAKEKDVHFVFEWPGPAIFWADPRFDITASIIEQLDKTAGAND